MRKEVQGGRCANAESLRSGPDYVLRHVCLRSGLGNGRTLEDHCNVMSMDTVHSQCMRRERCIESGVNIRDVGCVTVCGFQSQRSTSHASQMAEDLIFLILRLPTHIPGAIRDMTSVFESHDSHQHQTSLGAHVILQTCSSLFKK